MMEWFEVDTAEKAEAAYSERFGGWPYFLLMGADDDEVVWLARKALRTGREIDADEAEGDY